MKTELPINLGRFRLTEKIGAGAMGVVYRGQDPLIDREVAIKVIRTDLLEESDRDNYRKRFRQEAQSVGRCVHPGIVTIYDVAEQEGDPYIVMAYVPGQTLQRRLAAGPLSVRDGIDITLQVLDALAHAHARGVVHRDIKPANVILSQDRVILTDFGIARMSAAGLTTPGLMLGTPSYMAPEQARGESADHRADIFAVGMLLLRSVTGALPYGDGSVAVVLSRMAASEPIDVTALEDIDPRLATVTAMAVAKDVEQRFQSAEAFARMLRAMTIERTEEEIWPLDLPARPKPVPTATEGQGLAMPEWLAGALANALAETMGPIAAFMVAREARTARDIEHLVQKLAASIDDQRQQERFLAVIKRTLASRETLSVPQAEHEALQESAREPTSAPESTDDEPSLTPDVMSSAQLMLARFIGPIAGVLVKRSSLEARSLDGFGEQLASFIDKDEERDDFRKEFKRTFAPVIRDGRSAH
ncbi:serine/threonine protein kinase [Arboricoccus pini]|uniref:Serine/threonine protein kinase n=1 Tax=Arboricoccus pini TaxID=1963835 RepID=A0A212RQ33_9PROT|nr:serine/threonine-protein kinase [Arboricoccus pini]SNB74706.1 serine/threonine protein kinase [Arboricoccus pini]